jgi:hypothetical protein
VIKPLFVLALFVCAFVARPVEAGVILFTNLGVGGTASTTATGVGGNLDFDLAVPFTPSITANLESLQLSVYHGNGDNLYDTWLMSDSAGKPGAVIESFQSPWPDYDLTTFNSLLMPLLTAGTQYWVGVSGAGIGSNGGWRHNTTGDLGMAARCCGNTAWGTGSANVALALQVTGTNITAVPEPTSLLLFGTGAAALAAKARRRKEQQELQ